MREHRENQQVKAMANERLAASMPYVAHCNTARTPRAEGHDLLVIIIIADLSYLLSVAVGLLGGPPAQQVSDN